MHCASCGAPSVLGASRCPRCLAPFGAAGPMSGMILAEEEAPAPRPKVRWIGLGALALALLLAIGAWAARRMRGTPTVATVPVTVTPPPPMPTRVDTAVSVPDTVAARTTATVDTGRPTKPVVAPPSPTAPATPATVPSPGGAYRSTTWVWLRANPVNTAEQLGVVNPKQVVEILERRFGWARVRVDGKEGWMSADFLERVPE